MLRKHAHALALMSADKQIKHAVCEYFTVPKTSRRFALTPILYQRGLGQADLVLALLRISHPRARHYIELLIGHAITICAPCLLSYGNRNTSRPTVTRPEEPDTRRILWVNPTNPRQPGTQANLRWAWFQVGRSVGQLRVRGVKRRDIRKAADMGWIKLEEATHHVH